MPDAEHGFALWGGVAIYLLAQVARRRRGAHTLNAQRLVLGIVFLAAVPLATVVDAVVVLAAANVRWWVMIMYETRRYGDLRYPLRHGVRSEPGAAIGADRRVPGARPGP